jgi:hypothetical protein
MEDITADRLKEFIRMANDISCIKLNHHNHIRISKTARIRMLMAAYAAVYQYNQIAEGRKEKI